MNWSRLIENKTPYLGKIVLKFEKFPEYRSGKNILNKVHLDLGLTKLVSRMTYVQPDPAKVELISIYTNGTIGDHYSKEGDFTLENSFLTKKGDYIGNLQEGWFFYQNGLTLCDDCPRGVAQKNEVSENGVKVKYYGYTHRGGATFGIGDRLFDPNYTPKEEDYEPWQWAGWREQYLGSALNARKSGDDFGYKWIKEDGIQAFIPFTLRGSKTIETLEEAKQAAHNLSKYLS